MRQAGVIFYVVVLEKGTRADILRQEQQARNRKYKFAIWEFIISSFQFTPSDVTQESSVKFHCGPSVHLVKWSLYTDSSVLFLFLTFLRGYECRSETQKTAEPTDTRQVQLGASAALPLTKLTWTRWLIWKHNNQNEFSTFFHFAAK